MFKLIYKLIFQNESSDDSSLLINFPNESNDDSSLLITFIKKKYYSNLHELQMNL